MCLSIAKEAVMGIYLNPGSASFQMALDSEIYVDKTEMIRYVNSVVNTSQKYIAVSRPRRFGKSYAANMLCAYYGSSESRKLFETCKISGYENWDKYLGEFDVIRLVMTEFVKTGVNMEEAIVELSHCVTRDLRREYPDVEYYKPNNLIKSLGDVYAEKGRRFVVIIDEWDSIFRACKDDKESQKKYLDFLRDWLKDRDYIALAYMTGILPIKKYGEHSALNMFFEYSMISPLQLAKYTGFTDDEVKELCVKYNMRYEDVSDWYDGYIVSDTIPVENRKEYRAGDYEAHQISVYSPLSVVRAMSTGIIENYWNRTETYEALAEYINRDFDGMKETVAILMDGGRVKVNVRRYQNDMTTFADRDDVLTLLIHLGYLGYDSKTCEVFIPNKEILDEFKNSTENDKAWTAVFKAIKTSEDLLNAIWNMDEEKIARLMELAHDRTGNKTYNDEAALSYEIQYALYAAQRYYTTIQELDTGKGYADIVYLPSPKYSGKPALLVELKYNKDVKTAVDQVMDRNYPQVLEYYAGNILVVGINYDKDVGGEEFKKHSCRIEKV